MRWWPYDPLLASTPNYSTAALVQPGDDTNAFNRDKGARSATSPPPAMAQPARVVRGYDSACVRAGDGDITAQRTAPGTDRVGMPAAPRSRIHLALLLDVSSISAEARTVWP